MNDKRNGDQPIHKQLPSFKKKAVVPMSVIISAAVFVGWLFQMQIVPWVSASSLEKHRYEHKVAVQELQKKYEEKIKEIKEEIKEVKETTKEQTDQIHQIEITTTKTQTDVAHIKLGIERLLNKTQK